MNTYSFPDEALAHLLQCAQEVPAVDLLPDAQAAINGFPHDARLRTMQAILHRACGQAEAALDASWKALVLSPKDEIVRQELLFCVSEQMGLAAPDGHDFSLESGERQTAPHIHNIRADHRARYAWAARLLRSHFRDSSRLTGLDAFCGNGYGSRMISNLTGSRVIGIDGSTEAVELAERHYGNHLVAFGQAVFPFELTPGLFDYAVSFESVEHVPDSEALLAAIPFLPQSFTERMETIQNHKSDQSASTRVAVWMWTWEYAKDNPMGGGFSYRDAVKALDIALTGEEVAALEAPYRPKFPTGMGMPMPAMDKVSVLP